MKKSLLDIIDGWTLIFDRAEMEITLNEVSKPFYERKTKFMLLEDLWDLLEMMDDPLEFMTDIRMSHLIEKLLRDEEREKVARFVQLEVSDSPGLKLEVSNCDEAIAEFPEWFEEFEGVTWDDFKSSLLK